MESHFLYLIIDIVCLLSTVVFTFHKKIKFYKVLIPFLKSSSIVALFFIIWDCIFTKIGVWGFNNNYTLGVSILNLPIEEILFFFCIPYPCVFTYYCVTLFTKPTTNNKPFIILTYALISLLILIGLFLYSKIYTSITFILMAILLLYVVTKKTHMLKAFFISYAFILLPFFISNGILTGSFTKQPVVIYNNNYNLAIRLFTIPIEDVFYGMLLILLNIILFEKFNSKTVKNQIDI